MSVDRLSSSVSGNGHDNVCRPITHIFYNCVHTNLVATVNQRIIQIHANLQGLALGNAGAGQSVILCTAPVTAARPVTQMLVVFAFFTGNPKGLLIHTPCVREINGQIGTITPVSTQLRVDGDLSGLSNRRQGYQSGEQHRWQPCFKGVPTFQLGHL